MVFVVVPDPDVPMGTRSIEKLNAGAVNAKLCDVVRLEVFGTTALGALGVLLVVFDPANWREVDAMNISPHTGPKVKTNLDQSARSRHGAGQRERKSLRTSSTIGDLPGPRHRV